MYKEKKVKERIRLERCIFTTCGSRDETWLLHFLCLLVEAMVAVLIHWGWGKPMKHKVRWVNTALRLSGNAQVPPLERGVLQRWYTAVDHGTQQYSCLFIRCTWANYQKGLIPSGYVGSWATCGMIKSTITPHRVCLLSASSLILFSTQL